MVVEPDLTAAPPAHPPAHPPLATPDDGVGPGRPLSPPTYGPDATAGPGTFSLRSGPTAGLPPLPTTDRVARGPAWRRPSSPWLAAGAGVLVVVVIAGAVFGLHLGPASNRSTPRPRIAARPVPLDVPRLRQGVAPSVVSVSVTRPVAGSTATVTGSGVVIDGSGVILTTADLVAGASGLTVTGPDGHAHAAQLLGVLPDDDVALIQGSADLRPATLGRSSSVRVGDEVVAVGAADRSGAGASTAEGVVSARGTALTEAGTTVHDLIRTDAPIVASASGGALVDVHGSVIGLSVVLAGAPSGSGFALAMDAVKPLITQIEQGQAQDTPSSPSLGVDTQDVRGLSPAVVSQYGIQTSDGALVVRVASPSSAAAAGLAVGDVITAIDAQPVNGAVDVANAVGSLQVGDQVQITFERKGQILNAAVPLLSAQATGH